MRTFKFKKIVKLQPSPVYGGDPMVDFAIIPVSSFSFVADAMKNKPGFGVTVVATFRCTFQ